jgi:hypothetical protein
LASTKSAADDPIASRAARTRPASAAGSRPTFILTLAMPCSTQPASCRCSSTIGYDVNPPLPYTATPSRTRPRSVTSGMSRSRALRSHSAVSTAEIAIDAIPGRPRLRTARRIASQHAGTANASAPTTTGARTSRISRAVA